MPQSRLKHGGYGRVDEETRSLALAGILNQFVYVFPQLVDNQRAEQAKALVRGDGS